MKRETKNRKQLEISNIMIELSLFTIKFSSFTYKINKEEKRVYYYIFKLI